MKQGYWNYRLVRRQFPDDESLTGIYEAHYDTNSDVPHSISSEPTSVVADTGFQIADILSRMLEATNKPILRYEDFDTGK